MENDESELKDLRKLIQKLQEENDYLRSRLTYPAEPIEPEVIPDPCVVGGI